MQRQTNQAWTAPVQEDQPSSIFFGRCQPPAATPTHSAIPLLESGLAHRATTPGWRRGREREAQERDRRADPPEEDLSSPAGCWSAPCQLFADQFLLQMPSATVRGRGTSRRRRLSAAASAGGTRAVLRDGHNVQETITKQLTHNLFVLRAGDHERKPITEARVVYLGTLASVTWSICKKM